MPSPTRPLNSLDSDTRRLSLRITALALFFFITLALISKLIETTYAFGLLGVDIPPEAVFVLFLLSPALLLLYPRVLDGRAGERLVSFSGGLALLCWAASLSLDTRGKMLVCGVGAGAALLALPAMLRISGQRWAALIFGGGLGFAALISIALRAANHGSDFFMRPELAPLGWLLAAAAAGCYFLSRGQGALAERSASGEESAELDGGGAFWPVAGRCLGLYSALALVYFGFASPTVIARWTGGDYLWITALTAVPLVLVLGTWLALPRVSAALVPPRYPRGRAWQARPGGRLLLGWNLLFALALLVTLSLNSAAFPCCAESYPFYAADSGMLAQIALALSLLLHPVIYLDFGLLAQGLAGAPPPLPMGQRQPAGTRSRAPLEAHSTADRLPRAAWLAGGSAIAALYFLLLVFSQVLTTVYDYIPVAGPWLRDRFALVIVLPAAVLVFLVALARPAQPQPEVVGARQWVLPAAGGLLALAAILLAAFSAARPVPGEPKNSLRVLTYNIQQGYTKAGQKGLAAQLELIRAQNADIIGLQESDTARASGGNDDAVRYFADALKMYSYYGPKTTTGTFGIALLSRYPILEPRTFFMYSTGEQTAAIQARVDAGGKTFTILVTHLGNDGPLIQQQQVLQRLAGRDHIVAMGDFNFSPITEQYRLTTNMLDDSVLLAEDRQAAPGEDLNQSIDHIFVSPGTRVLQERTLASGPSDHPALLVEIGWQ